MTTTDGLVTRWVLNWWNMKSFEFQFEKNRNMVPDIVFFISFLTSEVEKTLRVAALVCLLIVSKCFFED